MKKSVLIVATVAIGSLISGTAVTEQDAKLSAEAARGKYVAQIAAATTATRPATRLPPARSTRSCGSPEISLAGGAHGMAPTCAYL